jgi:CHC2-type zinc finger protein
MDLDRGLFHCFACAVGGNIVNFVMLRDGVKFPRACQILGCWDDPAGGVHKRPPTRLVSFLAGRGKIECWGAFFSSSHHLWCSVGLIAGVGLAFQ